MPESAETEKDVAADHSKETAAEAPLGLSDLLVEDVSIDGMCGVY